MEAFYYILALIVLLFIVYRLVKWSKYKSLEPLLPHKYNFGKRRDTFRYVLDWLEKHDGRVLVETGVARMGLLHSKSDGASTIVFGAWAKQQGADKSVRLHSVDINQQNVDTCQETVSVEGLDDYITLNVSDSVAYLQAFEPTIDLLYLDSYDYDKRDPEVIKASQEHHLNEVKAAESNLHDKSVILIDDCNLPGGGKGRLVIDYLLERGWQVVMSKYQVVLTRA